MTTGFELTLTPTPVGHSKTSPRQATRKLARDVLRLSRGHALLAFRLIDQQLHLLVACSKERATRLMQELRPHLAECLDCGAVSLSLHRLVGRDELSATFYRLMALPSEPKHTQDVDHEVSNLPDLVGLRVNGDYTRLNVRALLPQVHGPELFAFLDMPSICPPEQLSSWSELSDAASAAFALPDLESKDQTTERARQAAIHVASRHLPVSRVSQLMRIQQRAVRNVRRKKANRSDIRAVRMQLSLRRIRELQKKLPPVESRDPKDRVQVPPRNPARESGAGRVPLSKERALRIQ